MPPDAPDLHLGQREPDPAAIKKLLAEARESFARKDVRKTADALCAAQKLAHHAGLHREATELRKAIVILAGGGKPKLLTRFPRPDHL